MSAHQRWCRLTANSGIGPYGLAQLHASHVAVAGAGALGGVVLQLLAIIGVRTTIIDKDIVCEENLANQGFAENMVGQPKAHARAAALKALHPSWRARPMHADLNRVGLAEWAMFDLIFSDLDSVSARAALSEIAVRTGRPWCDAAVDANGLPFGRVACYDSRLDAGACYICPHDASSLATAAAGGLERCPGVSGPAAASPPTLATPVLSSVVAGLQVHWAVEMLLGRMDGVAGSEAYVDLGGCALRRHRLVRNPSCLFDHRRFEPVEPLGAAAGGITVAETLREASLWLKGDVQLRLWRDAIATRLQCPQCGAARPVFRLLGALRPEETRCDCGGEMLPPATGLLGRFGIEEAEPFVDRTWAELGLPERDVVAARSDGREIYLRFD